MFRIVVHEETRTRGILKCKLLVNFDINSASSNGRKRYKYIEMFITYLQLVLFFFFFINGRGNSFVEMYERRKWVY